MGEAIQELLRTLGVNEILIDDYVGFFTGSDNVEELNEKVKKSYNSTAVRVMAPLFSEIYKRNPVIRDEAISQLSNLGVPVEEIKEYFTENGNPSAILKLQNEEVISFKTSERFVKKAEEFMLYTIKQHLGIG